MPRRTKPDPFSVEIGRRIRTLREEAGLTMEKLAYESDLGSKGHLSNIERGLVRPTAHTLKSIADRLEILPLDILTFPEQDERQALIDRTRKLSKGLIRRMLRSPSPGALAAELEAEAHLAHGGSAVEARDAALGRKPRPRKRRARRGEVGS